MLSFHERKSRRLNKTADAFPSGKAQRCEQQLGVEKGIDPMGWEFAALWVDDPATTWRWVWRRVADDSGVVLEESTAFLALEDCIADARQHGLDQSDCGAID